jgi:glycosyltransferase involved in cell wall biosynthesis
MRLLIISHTEHYQSNDQIYGWGPTVREIDQLAPLFTRVTHLAFFYPGQPPSSALPYQAKNVTFVPVPASGGDGLLFKLGILMRIPLYLWKISQELDRADVVHVRCPAVISLLAILLLAIRRTPRTRWIKYAGNWQPEGQEPWSYRFQRAWLRHGFCRANVTVNGNWPAQPAHIHSFFNPCLTAAEHEEGAILAKRKSLGHDMRIVFAGRLERAKGVELALRVVAQLQCLGVRAHLDLAGDGPDRTTFEALAGSLDLREQVCFHGWVSRLAMEQIYAGAHFILLPTTASEGWPKVLSEAMAYGAVPIASDISSIGQVLHRFDLGRAVKLVELDPFVAAFEPYLHSPEKWRQESERAIRAANSFTYASYLNAVQNLLDLPRTALEH